MERSATKDLSTEELFRLYAPFVARFLYRLGVRSDGLDDLVQEVFLVAHRNGGYRAGPAKPTSYLATIAQHAAQAHRRRARTQRSRHAEVDVEDLLAKGNSPVQFLETNDSLRLLQAALDRLDPPLRTTLILVEIEGESCTSVASAMGIPVGTVYFRLHQARKKFQAALKVAEASRLRVVPPPTPRAAGEHPEDQRRARVGMAFGADLLWQKSGAHDLLRMGFEEPPLSYETLAGLERHRQLATAGLPLPDWAPAGPAAPAGASAALGLGAGGVVAAACAALAAAVWLAPGVHGAVAAAPPGSPRSASPSGVVIAAALPAPGAAPALRPALATEASPPLPPGADVPGNRAPASVPVAAEPVPLERAAAPPPAAPAARVEAPASARRPDSSPITEPAPREQASRPAPAPVAEVLEPAPAPDDAHLESLQVAQAERLLSSDPARALAAARSAAARFPAGFLREERSYVEIAALARLGRKDEARAAAERFLRAYPQGAFAARVRRATEP